MASASVQMKPRLLVPVVCAFATVMTLAPGVRAADKTADPAPAARPAAPAIVDGQTTSDPMLQPVPLPAQTLGTLSEALARVKSRAVEYRIATLDVERAEAQARIALAGALPSMNAQLSGVVNILRKDSAQLAGVDANGLPRFTSIQLPIGGFVSAGASITHPLVNLRAWYAIGTARRGVDAQRLAVADQKRVLLASVASTLVSVYTTERLAELNRIGLRAALERLELATRREALGASTAIDVLRGRQDVAAARANVVSGDESVRQARESLGLLLGTADPVGVSPSLSLNTLEREAATACPASAAVLDRSDVLAARMRLTVSERQHRDAELQFAPSINLTSQLATTSQDTGAFPATTWNLQAILSVPIWEGGARYGALRDTAAQAEQARLRVEQAERRVTVEVRQADRAIEVAEQSHQVAVSSETLAREGDRLTRALFAEGRGSSLELVTSATALRQAQVGLALREFELVRARILAMLARASCDY
jgi:outer membrane protein TolC